MRRSEFLRAVDAEFGARGPSLIDDLFLEGLGRTAAEALDAGVPPREIWFALCAATDVPPARRHGAGLIEPPR